MRAVGKVALIAGGIALVAGGAAYWWATGGQPDRAEEPTWLAEEHFAHRGLHTAGPEAPENSLAAFEAAADAGYGFELDVQLTADDHVIIMHDEDLARMTGDDRLITDVELAEIEELRLLDGEERVPTLAEALEIADSKVPVLVEIKNEGTVGDLEDAVAEELASYDGPAAVISFNPYSLARVAKSEPQIIRGQLSSYFEGEDLEGWKKAVLGNMLMNWNSKPDFIAYEIGALPSIKTSVQKARGRMLLGWTPKSVDERDRALETCDNIICDPGALDAP